MRKNPSSRYLAEQAIARAERYLAEGAIESAHAAYETARALAAQAYPAAWAQKFLAGPAASMKAALAARKQNPRSQYDKVKALAERGATEHERATAARILAHMSSPAREAKRAVDAQREQAAVRYRSNADALRSLREGDRVEVVFAARSATSPDEKRVLTVTGAHSGVFYNVFVNSGRVQHGNVYGGNISDHGDAIYYQPTMQQPIREVRTLRKLERAVLPNPVWTREGRKPSRRVNPADEKGRFVLPLDLYDLNGHALLQILDRLPPTAARKYQALRETGLNVRGAALSVIVSYEGKRLRPLNAAHIKNPFSYRVGKR